MTRALDEVGPHNFEQLRKLPFEIIDARLQLLEALGLGRCRDLLFHSGEVSYLWGGSAVRRSCWP